MKRDQFLERVKKEPGRWYPAEHYQGFADLVKSAFGEDEEILGHYAWEIITDSSIRGEFVSTTSHVVTEKKLIGFQITVEEVKYDSVPLDQIERVHVQVPLKSRATGSRTLLGPDRVPSAVSICLTSGSILGSNPVTLPAEEDKDFREPNNNEAKELLNAFIASLNEAMSRRTV